jgi:hypothetical protein
MIGLIRPGLDPVLFSFHDTLARTSIRPAACFLDRIAVDPRIYREKTLEFTGHANRVYADRSQRTPGNEAAVTGVSPKVCSSAAGLRE